MNIYVTVKHFGSERAESRARKYDMNIYVT